jgi:hypothetical protein
MSASDKFNALPEDQRKMLGTLLLEAELRLIELEKSRIRREANSAIMAHTERADRIKAEIKSRIKAP